MRRLLCLLAVLPLALVACGDDEESLSREDYLAEGNQICEDGADRTEEISEDIVAAFEEGEPSDDELRELLDRGLDEIQSQIDAIRELEGPDDLESDVQEVLDDADEAIAEVRDATADDPMKAAESTAFDNVNRALTEVGLDECGEES